MRHANTNEPRHVLIRIWDACGHPGWAGLIIGIALFIAWSIPNLGEAGRFVFLITIGFAVGNLVYEEVMSWPKSDVREGHAMLMACLGVAASTAVAGWLVPFLIDKVSRDIAWPQAPWNVRVMVAALSAAGVVAALYVGVSERLKARRKRENSIELPSVEAPSRKQ